MARVLVVDDDSLMRGVVKKVLEHFGHKVIEAEDGLYARDLMLKITSDEEDFDLVISDCNMPRMTGLELLQWVRSTQKELEFILMSGRPDQEDGVNLPEECVTFDALFLEKPFDMASLTETVNKLLT